MYTLHYGMLKTDTDSYPNVFSYPNVKNILYSIEHAYNNWSQQNNTFTIFIR